ncbi:MAG: YtxH domain-containing protein [Acidobacteria bacterium]|nr:YtxH domain-containing protein [Acidobacteriota bacterium]
MRDTEYYEDIDQAGGGGNRFMMGMLWGAAVGAAVGLLFAPRAGSELRGQLSQQADRLRRRASDGYSKASDAVNDLVERGRDAVDQGRQKFEEVRSDFERQADIGVQH